jgi:hypothetical protein
MAHALWWPVPLALVEGTVVWLGLVACGTIWLAALLVARGALIGPRRVMRWFLRSWLSRLTVLAAWGVAGWHIFCQRP